MPEQLIGPVWQEIAYAFNEQELTGQVPVTDDFFVFVHWEGIELYNGELQRAIPQAKLAVLQAKGLSLMKVGYRLIVAHS